MIKITDGNIMLDGEHIGAVNGDNAEMLRDPGPKVKGEINAAHGSKLKFVFGNKPATAAKHPNPGASISPPEASIEIKDTRTPTEQRAAKLKDYLHLQSAAMGDKTPAFVNAARDVLTESEFAAHYGNRRIPADLREFERGEKKRHGKLKDEQEDVADA